MVERVAATEHHAVSGNAPHPTLWSDIRGGTPRSLLIAGVVGTFLVAVNLGDHLTQPSPALGARLVLTYLTPFVVSMLGWVSAMRADRRRASAPRGD